jgi:hypothetical protein
MAGRLREIFGDPNPPATVTQVQFDGAQKYLHALATKPWSEIGPEEYWAYLLDLCYQPLQQDLFDYAFPAFLLRWWEGQLNRFGGPESECDFYQAVDHGDIFRTMMSDDRRAASFAWMVDAYMEGVDAWSGRLSVEYDPNGPNDLHGPLWSFHALGQSVPILEQIWPALSDVTTAGRAQWWLVLATGLAYKANTCPAIPARTPQKGGGGVYVQESAASIFAHGYLPANLDVVRTHLTPTTVTDQLARSASMLEHEREREWCSLVVTRIEEDPDAFAWRLELFLDYLGRPDLGGVTSDWY